MTVRLFSVISPVYNVAAYLEEYFGSLETQTIGIEKLEIILVDDGSTDDSLELCHRFASRYPGNVHVFHKENGGQASARNMGLTFATAPWVCFPDPDDVLSSNFFDAIHDYMGEPGSEATRLFAGHIILWDEASGQRTDSHATAFRFAIGNSTTDLTGQPNFIHGNAVMSFFDRSVIVHADLRFDERLRTRFEDGSFISQYLLLVDRPILGLVNDASYFYRRRSDGSSTNQTSQVDPRSYTDVPEFGYLAVLRLAQERHGAVPRWLQWLVVYDIMWLFKVDVAKKRATRSLTPEVLSEFHSMLGQVMGYIEPESVLGFDMMRMPYWIREALAFGYSSAPRAGQVYLGPTDAARDLIQIHYRFTGDLRAEAIFIDGERVNPRYAKTQALEILGRTLLKERRLWVSSVGAIGFEIDGQMRQFATSEPDASTYRFRRNQIVVAEQSRAARAPVRFRQIDGTMRAVALEGCRRWARSLRDAVRKESVYDLALVTLMRSSGVRRDFVGAWALIDKAFEANDSAEQLYRWIRANRPNVNIWFVLGERSGDWARLKGDGFKLVAYRSFRWKMLMLMASHVVSSHADGYISNPLPARRYGPPQWKLSFLQHGIIKGDLSPWLNSKDIAFMATSTEDEYEYISGDSVYKFGREVVRLTGLPRHDALLEKSAGIPAADVDQILIAPTWREYLVGRLSTASDRDRNVAFMESEFAQAWQALVQSDALREFATTHRLRVVFMPHPNIQPYIDQFAIPDWVETRLYGEVDVQDVVGRSAVMITDYSSAAFNMAYLQRPVVYFQFDQARYDVEHTEGKGYFDYESHGFGPVRTEAAGVVDALRALRDDCAFSETYVERARKTFPVRDGKNSERVFTAIEELNRPLSREQASIAATPDAWKP